jgi:hypothetical protein
VNLVAALGASRKQGGADLLRADFRAAGHASILRLRPSRHCDFVCVNTLNQPAETSFFKIPRWN